MQERYKKRHLFWKWDGLVISDTRKDFIYLNLNSESTYTYNIDST